MTESDDEPTDVPATWENVVVGKAKELAGRATGNDELEEQGEEQVGVAFEVREDFERHRD